MIHCVGINNSYHLFTYGELVCYTKWQIGIIAVILPGLVMFPITYELSLRMLKRRAVSSTNFIAATACPHYTLFLFVYKYQSMKQGQETISITSPQEEEFASRVLQAEEDLFCQNNRFLNWQCVQFYRTIAMNIATIFITNPVYRFLSLVPILSVFYAHDRSRCPYKNDHLNRLQAFSTLCLLFILVCNLVASVSFIADISMVNNVSSAVRICSIVEIMLYGLVPLYFPIWKVWDIVITIRRKKRV